MAPKKKKKNKSSNDDDDPGPSTSGATTIVKKKKRTYSKRDGEFIGKELRDKIFEHAECTWKKSHLAKMNKLMLCDIASKLKIINSNEYKASLARKSEGRKCYLMTVLRYKRLFPTVRGYVEWWSQVYARGSIIANCFVSSGIVTSIESLMDLTTLKKLLYPERFPVNALPEGLSEWLSVPTRRAHLATMAPVSQLSRSIEDQGMSYMARRYRGHIKGHVLTHLHSRICGEFVKRFHKLDVGFALTEAMQIALVNGNFQYISTDAQESWRIVKLREILGLHGESTAGNRVPENGDDAEDAMLQEAEEGGDDDDSIDTADMAMAWMAHQRLCSLGVASLLPLADLKLQHAIIDSRIASCMVNEFNKSVKRGRKLQEVAESKVLSTFFLPSRSFMKQRKKARRKRSKRRPRQRRQYIKAGVGNLVPRDGVLKSIQTDSVAATLTSDVPIMHEERILRKRKTFEEMLDKMRTSQSKLDSQKLDAILDSREIAIDPGDVNTIASVELARTPKSGGPRPAIHTHLSKRNYEKRTLRNQHAAWEASCRQINQPYRQALDSLSRAGTWKSTDPMELDAMIEAKARAWSALRAELVFNNEHAVWKMKMYRKRRMVLDQAARRMLNPTKDHIVDKKKRGVIVGIGNATFKSQGPRLQMIKAILRILKTMRASGSAFVALVFVDEFRTTMLCHRCHRRTTSPKKKTCKGKMVEDHRYRDCPHCGDQTTQKRWGRDSNAALNILRNLTAMVNGTEIPVPFRRSTPAKDVP